MVASGRQLHDDLKCESVVYSSYTSNLSLVLI